MFGMKAVENTDQLDDGAGGNEPRHDLAASGDDL